MLLPLWLFHWIFWAGWISCPVSQVPKKVREKAEYLICSLASNFWPVTNIRKTWTWEFVLSLNSWNWTWNLRGYISHVVAKKACLSPPGGENEERRGWAVFCHTESRKKSQRSQKAKRSSNQIKRVKENAWMLKLGEVC